MEAVERIRAVAERVVQSHGLELFDVQLRRESLRLGRPRLHRQAGSSGTPEDSVSIEDCAVVSREISTILDVEDPLDRAYTLEVSSPGLDRPLRDARDFGGSPGRAAKVVVERAGRRPDGVRRPHPRASRTATSCFEAQGRKWHRIAARQRSSGRRLDVEF